MVSFPPNRFNSHFDSVRSADEQRETTNSSVKTEEEDSYLPALKKIKLVHSTVLSAIEDNENRTASDSDYHHHENNLVPYIDRWLESAKSGNRDSSLPLNDSLHIALGTVLKKGDLESAKNLISWGANPCAKIRGRERVLFFLRPSRYKGTLEAFIKLLSLLHTKNFNLIQHDGCGFNLLHYACQEACSGDEETEQRIGIIKTLMSIGFDLFQEDKRKITPFLLICANPNDRLLDFVLSCVAPTKENLQGAADFICSGFLLNTCYLLQFDSINLVKILPSTMQYRISRFFKDDERLSLMPYKHNSIVTLTSFILSNNSSAPEIDIAVKLLARFIKSGLEIDLSLLIKTFHDFAQFEILEKLFNLLSENEEDINYFNFTGNHFEEIVDFMVDESLTDAQKHSGMHFLSFLIRYRIDTSFEDAMIDLINSSQYLDLISILSKAFLILNTIEHITPSEVDCGIHFIVFLLKFARNNAKKHDTIELIKELIEEENLPSLIPYIKQLSLYDTQRNGAPIESIFSILINRINLSRRKTDVIIKSMFIFMHGWQPKEISSAITTILRSPNLGAIECIVENYPEYLRQIDDTVKKQLFLTTIKCLFSSLENRGLTLLQKLLHLGVDPNLQFKYGITIIFYMVFLNHLKGLKSFENTSADFLHIDELGNSILHHAANFGSKELVDFCLDKCMNYMDLPNKKGEIPWQIALLCHNHSALEVFQRRCHARVILQNVEYMPINHPQCGLRAEKAPRGGAMEDIISEPPTRKIQTHVYFRSSLENPETYFQQESIIINKLSSYEIQLQLILLTILEIKLSQTYELFSYLRGDQIYNLGLIDLLDQFAYFEGNIERRAGPPGLRNVEINSTQLNEQISCRYDIGLHLRKSYNTLLAGILEIQQKIIQGAFHEEVKCANLVCNRFRYELFFQLDGKSIPLNIIWPTKFCNRYLGVYEIQYTTLENVNKILAHLEELFLKLKGFLDNPVDVLCEFYYLLCQSNLYGSDSRPKADALLAILAYKQRFQLNIHYPNESPFWHAMYMPYSAFREIFPRYLLAH